MLVDWVLCKERMPDSPLYVWVNPPLTADGEIPIPVASWHSGRYGQWWVDDLPLGCAGITHWAKIDRPEPPEEA